MAGLLRRLLRRPPALTDVLLEASMAGAIEAARARHAAAEPGPGDASTWRPGSPLKLLLAGYLGTRNTGADVRVAEMIRQLRALVGDEQPGSTARGPSLRGQPSTRYQPLELTVLTSDPRCSAGYFPGVRQLRVPDLFVPFLYRETLRHHGVVACEGSMFKSKFANALTTFMVGALGLAVSQNKLAVGYGAEAGDMDPVLEALVTRYCEGALVLVRNEASQGVLARLGVETAPGTDTAWTFAPTPAIPAPQLLQRSGWDGSSPVVAACPVNPFWWPVRPRPTRALLDHLRGYDDETHYRALYYHAYGSDDRDRFAAYLDALAEGIGRFSQERGAQPVVVGMERLDRAACEGLAARLEARGAGRVPVLVSDRHDMHSLVSVLRHASWLVSSRYHALVCSMPAGVPSLGVTMDERIANLMDQRGQPELSLEVDDPDLADLVLDGLRRLDTDGDVVRAGIQAALRRELLALGRMGQTFLARLSLRYPELPLPPRGDDPREYLPPLTPGLEALLA
jgi:polysaccharide pyruvyl transferase WcaK-like protein